MESDLLKTLPCVGPILSMVLMLEIVSNKRMLSSVNTVMDEYLHPSHQRDWSEPTKFNKLRIKTEMQLVQLINIELDLGLQDARQALKSADTWPVREECNRKANRAYTKAARLIPLAAEVTDDERSRMEARLERLQRMLEALSAIGSTPAPAEDEIAALGSKTTDMELAQARMRIYLA